MRELVNQDPERQECTAAAQEKYGTLGAYDASESTGHQASKRLQASIEVGHALDPTS